MLRSHKRTIDFWTKFKVMTTFPGDWESIFKGEGDEFFGLREYTSGDDYRKVHWPTFAKTKRLYLRENIALRDLRVYVLLDVGPSMSFHAKSHHVDSFLAVLGVGALRARVPVGILAFDREPRLFLKARQGKTTFSELVSAVTSLEPRTDFPTTLQEELVKSTFRKIPRRSLVFLVSDFLAPEFRHRTLAPLIHSYDLIPVIIRDRFEVDFPIKGEIRVRDVFSGEESTLLISKSEREAFRAHMAENMKQLTNGFRTQFLDWLLIDSDEVEITFERLSQLFRIRKERRRV